jgi:hypothetical protein
VTPLDDAIGLIDDLPLPGDDPATTTGRVSFSSTVVRTRTVSPKKTGSRNCHSLMARKARVHGRGVEAESGTDGEHEQAVSDGTAKRGHLRKLVVDVDGVEVAGETREVDDVRLGEGATERDPLLADGDIVEVQVRFRERHGPLLTGGYPVSSLPKTAPESQDALRCSCTIVG